MDSRNNNDDNNIIEIPDDSDKVISLDITDDSDNTFEEVLIEWDEKIRKKLTTFIVAANVNILEDIMKEYLEEAREMNRNFEDYESYREKAYSTKSIEDEKYLDYELFRKKISAHVNFMYLYFVELRSFTLDTYLDIMEDILTVYCNLELEILYPLTRQSKQYKKRISTACDRIIKTLTLFLLNRSDHMLHVILKMSDSYTSDPCREAWQVIYHHFLTKIKVNHSDDEFCRSYILFQRWKELRAPTDWPHMDQVMFKRFKRTRESIRVSKTLRDILMPECRSVVDVVVQLHRSTKDISEAYFRYVAKKKSVDVECCIDFNNIDLGVDDDPNRSNSDELDEDMAEFERLFANTDRNDVFALSSHRNSEAACNKTQNNYNSVEKMCKEEMDDDDVEYVGSYLRQDTDSVSIMSVLDETITEGSGISASCNNDDARKSPAITIPEEECNTSQPVQESTNLETVPVVSPTTESRDVSENPMSVAAAVEENTSSTVVPSSAVSEEDINQNLDSTMADKTSNEDDSCLGDKSMAEQTSESDRTVLVSNSDSCCGDKTVTGEKSSSDASTAVTEDVAPTKTVLTKSVEVQVTEDSIHKNYLYQCGLTTPPSDATTDDQDSRLTENCVYTDIRTNNGVSTEVVSPAPLLPTVDGHTSTGAFHMPGSQQPQRHPKVIVEISHSVASSHRKSSDFDDSDDLNDSDFSLHQRTHPEVLSRVRDVSAASAVVDVSNLASTGNNAKILRSSSEVNNEEEEEEAAILPNLLLDSSRSSGDNLIVAQLTTSASLIGSHQQQVPFNDDEMMEQEDEERHQVIERESPPQETPTATPESQPASSIIELNCTSSAEPLVCFTPTTPSVAGDVILRNPGDNLNATAADHILDDSESFLDFEDNHFEGSPVTADTLRDSSPKSDLIREAFANANADSPSHHIDTGQDNDDNDDDVEIEVFTTSDNFDFNDTSTTTTRVQQNRKEILNGNSVLKPILSPNTLIDPKTTSSNATRNSINNNNNNNNGSPKLSDGTKANNKSKVLFSSARMYAPLDQFEQFFSATNVDVCLPPKTTAAAISNSPVGLANIDRKSPSDSIQSPPYESIEKQDFALYYRYTSTQPQCDMGVVNGEPPPPNGIITSLSPSLVVDHHLVEPVITTATSVVQPALKSQHVSQPQPHPPHGILKKSSTSTSSSSSTTSIGGAGVGNNNGSGAGVPPKEKKQIKFKEGTMFGREKSPTPVELKKPPMYKFDEKLQKNATVLLERSTAIEQQLLTESLLMPHLYHHFHQHNLNKSAHLSNMSVHHHHHHHQHKTTPHNMSNVSTSSAYKVPHLPNSATPHLHHGHGKTLHGMATSSSSASALGGGLLSTSSALGKSNLGASRLTVSSVGSTASSGGVSSGIERCDYGKVPTTSVSSTTSNSSSLKSIASSSSSVHQNRQNTGSRVFNVPQKSKPTAKRKSELQSDIVNQDQTKKRKDEAPSTNRRGRKSGVKRKQEPQNTGEASKRKPRVSRSAPKTGRRAKKTDSDLPSEEPPSADTAENPLPSSSISKSEIDAQKLKDSGCSYYNKPFRMDLS